MRIPRRRRWTVVPVRWTRTEMFSQASGAGNRFGQVLSVGCRAIAAAGSVDRRCRCSLRDVATVQEDAGLDDPEGDEASGEAREPPTARFR